MAKYVEFSPVSISCLSAVSVQDKPRQKEESVEKNQKNCLDCPDVLLCTSWFDKSKCKFDSSATK